MTGPGAGLEGKVGLFVSILNAAAVLLVNPAFGIEGAGKIAALVGFAASLIKGGAKAADELSVVNTLIQKCVAENRAPTEAEWNAWEARLSAVDDSAARRKEELG